MNISIVARTRLLVAVVLLPLLLLPAAALARFAAEIVKAPGKPAAKPPKKH